MPTAAAGIARALRRRILVVLRLAKMRVARILPTRRRRLLAIAEHRPAEGRPVVVSALTGEGIDRLKAAIEQRLSGERPVFIVELDPADGAALHWLYKEAEILDRRSGEDSLITVAARLAPEKEPRLLKRFPGARRLR